VRTAEHMRVVIDRFDAIASEYASGQGRRLDTSRLLTLAELSDTDRVLDVATGTGAFAHAAAERARVVVGVDVSSRMLAEAVNGGGDSARRPVFLRASAQRLPFVASSFDVAACCRALHHVAEPDGAVAEIARVLRPGGRFVLMDNATMDEPAFAREHNRLERVRDPSHARTLSAAELRALVHSAGLRVASLEVEESFRAVDQWLEDSGADAGVRMQLRSEIARRRATDDPFYVRHFVDLTATGMAFCCRAVWLVAEKPER
jgi:ubiquinone/menaquinone biosynthesis C-methylase UbiE